GGHRPRDGQERAERQRQRQPAGRRRRRPAVRKVLTMSERVIEIGDLRKVYRMGEIEVEALKGISLAIERGELAAIMGPSGSGKSTLMNILVCLDRPTSGTYLLDGVDVSRLDRDQRADIRSAKI